ncbi:MAG: mechanosensitive ion channel family protein [Desulfobacterales bacterium]|nr:mechanosensitive ion channel family protein [Desulfobacterales bacterium]
MMKFPTARTAHDPLKRLRLGAVVLLAMILSGLNGLPAAAIEDIYPLAPPDLSSPRSTLAYFSHHMNQAYQIQLKAGFKSLEARAHIQKAVQSLNLSKVAPADRQDVGFETTLLLKEIMDRLELPTESEIPDAAVMQLGNLTHWTIPHTEITVASVAEGPHAGQYRFTPETVDRIRDFYDRIQNLPYKEGAAVGIYEDYIFSPGPLIPNRIINVLPQWAHAGYFEQAVWQWVSALVLMMAGALAVMIVFRWSRTGADRGVTAKGRASWRQFVPPVTLLVVSGILRYLVDEQINFTGAILEYFTRTMRILLFLAGAWLILVAGRGFTELIVNSPRLRPKHIDPNLTRLLCKLFTWVLLIFLVWNVSEYLGVSFTAVFASAGIAGIALALAARETLANFFGGISILMDRPFKTGDFILLESGERGMVVNVGMRSTRIMTRDDVQIAIPNSIITNTKVVNESAPQPRFRIRIKIGVAYDSDIDQVEQTLLAVAGENSLVSPTPEPRVRFRAFGDSALDFELLCWARCPLDKGRLIHGLNQAIYKTFKAEGIEIPFPQRDVHFIKGD